MALSTGARKRSGAFAAAAVTVGFGALLLANYGPGAAPKPLLLATPLAGLPDLGDYAWNLAARSQPVALALWLLVAEAFGWLAWPLVARICDCLPDRGLSSAKTVGLLIVAWLVWIAASLRLPPFTVWTILAAAVVLALVRRLAARGRMAALRQFCARNRASLVLRWEALFLLAFAALLGLRLLEPRPLDSPGPGRREADGLWLPQRRRCAAPRCPRPIPFFAGGYINYYYYGQFLMACPLKLIGALPSVGYNLALPHLYALLVVGAAGVVYNAVLARGAGRQPSAGAWPPPHWSPWPAICMVGCNLEHLGARQLSRSARALPRLGPDRPVHVAALQSV